VRAGGFDETAAVGLVAVEAEGRGARKWIVPIDRLLGEVPAVVLNDRGTRRATHGNDIAVEDLRVSAEIGASGSGSANEGHTRWRLLDEAGTLLAIAESRAGGVLHPVVVLV
jgi:hypothetical protein